MVFAVHSSLSLMFLHAHLARQQLCVFWCLPCVLMEHTRLLVHTNISSISLAFQKRENKKVCMSICLKMCCTGCQSRLHIEGCARKDHCSCDCLSLVLAICVLLGWNDWYNHLRCALTWQTALSNEWENERASHRAIMAGDELLMLVQNHSGCLDVLNESRTFCLPVFIC